MKIKRYSTPEEARRDISMINRSLKQIDRQIDQFQEALAFAYQRINAAITLRDSKGRKKVALDTNKSKIKNIPARALKDNEIAKTFTQLQMLTEQRSIINNIIIQLEQNFDQERNVIRMLTDARKTRKKLEKSLTKARKVSDQLASRHLPKAFENRVKSVYNKLRNQMINRFEDSSLQFIIAKVDRTIQYTGYINLTELRDDEGFTYSDFYIVIAQVLYPTGASVYHLTTLTDFRLPGKFSFSKYSKIDKLQNIGQLVSERLASEKFVSKVSPKKLPLTPEQIQFNHQKIERTNVRDNRIYVTLKKKTSKATANATRIDLQGQLTNLVKARFPRNRDVIRGRIYKSGDKWRIQFVFTISRNYRGVMLDNKTREKFKDILNISDKQLNRLQEALDQIGDN